MARIITFVSGKGGVGKTTVSTNFAQALYNKGKKVVIIDANVTTPNVTLHFGLPMTSNSIHDALSGKKKISSIIQKTETGLMVIPGGLNFNALKTKIKKSLSSIIVDLVDKFDYIIIDAGAGLGFETQLAIKAADEMVLVTNPELPAITDALKAKKLAEELRVDLVGVVLNKKTGLDFDLKDQNIVDFLELPIIANIPYDVHVNKSIKERVPVIVSYPKAKASKAIKKLANYITHEELFIEDKPDNKFIAWLKNALGMNQ